MHAARFAAIATLIVASPAYSASSFTSLYSFTGGSDGGTPMAGLVADSNGNLYGTTAYGGANNYGTVFEFTAAHQLVTLWTFTGGTDGSYPLGGLVLHGEALYGTTSAGGGTSGSGTIFSLYSATKQLTTLYSFSGPDGAEPHSTLFREKSGLLVGTTFGGSANGYGEVFRLNPKSKQLTRVYAFQNGPDGANPAAGIIEDASGNIFGTTFNGGGNGNQGTAYEITAGGAESVLYDFNLDTTGCSSVASPTLDTSGNLYFSVVGCDYYGSILQLSQLGGGNEIFNPNGTSIGIYGGGPEGAPVVKGTKVFATASHYGPNDDGTIVEINMAGNTVKVLHAFAGIDGINPTGNLLVKSGLYFGITTYGGASDSGTIFSFNP